MNERDWLIFQVLYEKRNVTKTAQSLYLSQPALTARLHQIEEELGTKLLYKLGRDIHFTPQGEYLAKTSTEILDRIQEIKNQIANMHEGVRGTLRIAASHYMTKYKLPRLLKLFHTEYPHIEFKVMTVWSKEIVNLVNHHEVHVGFVRGEYVSPDEKKLLFEEKVCVASTEPFALEDLPRLPRINYHSDEYASSLVDKWWQENFKEAPRVNMEVDRLDTCKEMVLNGHGYAIMPNQILQDVPNLYKVPITHKDGTPIIRNTWLVYPKTFLELHSVKAFVEFTSKIDFITL